MSDGLQALPHARNLTTFMGGSGDEVKAPLEESCTKGVSSRSQQPADQSVRPTDMTVAVAGMQCVSASSSSGRAGGSAEKRA